MPTSAEKFSSGYAGKKPKRRGKEVAGPYRSQSSKPSIRKKATPREHRRLPRRQPSPEQAKRNREAAAALVVKPLSQGPTRAEQRRQARLQAALQKALAPLHPTSKGGGPKVPTLTAAGPTTGKSWSPGDPLAIAVERDVIKPLQDEGKLPKHPTTGQQIYQKIAEWGPTVITAGPELKAASSGLKAALAGAESEGVTVGSKRVLSRVLKPSSVSTAEGRAAVAARAEQRAALKSASGVKGALRRGASRATAAGARADAKAARAALGKQTRREAAAAAGAPLKVAKVGASQTLPVVRGHEQALIEHPKTTARTTARAIPGLVTAPVGLAAHVGITGGRAVSAGLHEAGVPGFRPYSGKEIAGPVVGEFNAQLAFAKQVAATVTASDSKQVQKTVESELGFMLPIMLGLGAGAVTKKITRGRVTEAVRRIAEDVRSRSGRGHGVHQGATPRVFEKSGQRKAEAVRTANARGRIRREVADRTRRVRAEAGKVKGEEVVRRGVLTKGKVIKRKGDLKIRGGDVVGFAVRHALPLDKPAEALAEVKRIGAHLKDLPEGVRLPADSLSTRDVIAFIERNPKVLADKHLRREVDAYKKQAQYARETPGLSPEDSARARYTSTAVTRDIPLTQERFPQSIRGDVRAKPTRGRNAKDVLRREARSDRTRAKRLAKKAATREARARAIRRELGVRHRAEPTRVKTNSRVAAQADRLTSQAETYRRGAKAAAEMAKRKHKAATQIDPSVGAEFVDEMRGILEREGKPQPEYVHTGRAREAPTYGATGAKLTQFPGKSKFRKGGAEEYGLVQEGLAPTLRESVARPVSRRESYKAMRGFLDANEFRVGKKAEWTSDEARQLFENGVVDRNRYVLIPRQLYKRAYKPDEWAGQLKAAMDADPTEALKSGRRFKLVRRTAAKEFFDQMGTEHVSTKLAALNRATSYLILGTSPAWAAAQVVAEVAQAAAAQPKILNPLFVRKAIKAYNAMAPEKRQAFDSWVGVTSRALDKPEDLSLGLKAGDAAAGADAFAVFNRTPLGRFIKSIPQSIRDLDQWKGGRIRVLTTSAKIDGELNGFLSGIRGLYGEIGKHAAAVRGKGLKAQMEYIAEHPELSKRYQSYLDDVMGNWSALTHNERIASQLVIFYPFIRMSLRWTFYSFPKRHPIKAATMAYLAQSNATQLKQLYGHDPSFFTGWAQVPLHLTAHGKPHGVIPLERIAPGSNALIETLGEDTEKPIGAAALRVMQPGLVALETAITGVDPLSGEQKGKALPNALHQIATLSPLVRVADELSLGTGQKRKEGALPVVGSTERQESLDKLFAKLNQYGTPQRTARTLGVPFLPKNAGYEKDLIRLRNILNALSENSSTAVKELATEVAKRGIGKPPRVRERMRVQGLKRKAKMEKISGLAQNELNGLFDKYKIPYKKEGDEFGNLYGEVYYESKPNRPTSIGGVAISGNPKESPTTSIAGVPIGSAGEQGKRKPKSQRKVTTIGGVPIR